MVLCQKGDRSIAEIARDLGAELRIGAGADQHEVSNEADELVGEAEKHAGRSGPIAPNDLRRDSLPQPKRCTPGRRLARQSN